MSDDLQPLDDLMPWSVAPLRPGRPWPTAPDARTLRTRWTTLVQADPSTREHLFRPTRTRTLHTRVPALPLSLPGPAGTAPLALESGPCPAPVRFTHGPFDQQWLIPDHRLLDAARPELWRVADARQLFVVEQGHLPRATGTALTVSALLPDGRPLAGRPGRIRPLYRRPGGAEPNIAPGLLALLGKEYGREVAAEDLFAWIVAAARPSPAGCEVPLTLDPLLWERGVELGHRITELTVRGARGGEKPRLPGGRRPYVRAAIPPRPDALRYDPEDESLYLGEGRVSPVPRGAWEFEVSGVRVLEAWFERRADSGEPGTLEAVRPASWPQEWTSDLLELITVLALLDELRPRARELADGPRLTRGRLVEARVLPVPASARRPASVLDHQEEGPDGQLTLL